MGPFICANNSYYRNIIELHFSIVVCKSYIDFTGNNARQILQAKDGSYVIISELIIINMSRNNVYMVAKQEHMYGDNSWPICPVQFHSYRGNIDKFHLSDIGNFYKLRQCAYDIKTSTPGHDNSFGNCIWLSGTAFNKRSAELVYNMVMKIAHTPINKMMKRLIPLIKCLSMHQCNWLWLLFT